jgi:hypothetical protein
MTTCPNCGHEFKPAPQIKVLKHAPFFVNVDHGLATDTFTLGPVDVYCGKTAKLAIELARNSEDHYAQVNSTRKSTPDFVVDFIGHMLEKADLMPAEEAHTDYWTDLSADCVTVRVNRIYHAAMVAVSDAVLIDRTPEAPVVYTKHDTVVALVMPIRTEES